MEDTGRGACVSASSAPYHRTDNAPFNPHFHKAIPLEQCSPLVPTPYLLISLLVALWNFCRTGCLGDAAIRGRVEVFMHVRVTLLDVGPLKSLMGDSQRAVYHAAGVI